jgi:hypothetical protein
MLLYQEEGQKTMFHPGLLQAQHDDSEKPVSTPTHSGVGFTTSD